MKKSIVRKSISRKLSTAQYETLDVTVEIEEEIEWNNVEERTEKTNNVTKVLILDFKNTIAQSLKHMKLSKKLASVTGSSDNKN
jgi:hypothetical protein